MTLNRTGTLVSDRRLVLIVAALVLALVGTLTIASASPATADAKLSKKEKAKKKAKKQRGITGVMTRNLYLGADLGPAIDATSFTDFISKNGQILRDVDTNNFKVRAGTLANEIKTKSPDLVGLQEVALWRTGAADFAPPASGVFKAETVHIDYLAELMAQLNKGKQRYRVVKVQDEFDFEAPADYDNDPSTGAATLGGEINGRLTMRDAIIAKVGAGVKVMATDSANFTTIYQPVISGLPVNVDRGWVSADVKVRKSPKFRFVNTHLEAFGDQTIREAQAKELIAEGGPLDTGKLPAVLVGDLNSDDNTVEGDDRLAYNALKAGGLVDRSTEKPMSCCVEASILTDDMGARSDFGHHIDHIMTNKPKRVKRLNSSVTGLKPVNGYWPSDHAGVFSKLRIR